MSKYSYEVEPISIFGKELVEIENDRIQELTAMALEKAPEYFFFAPASTSGKYHSKNNLGMGGLVRHTKEVFWIGQELLNHPTFGGKLSNLDKDICRSAMILHDACKQGFGEGGSTVTEHPLLVKDLLDKNDLGGPINFGLWGRICRVISTHMGPWTKNREGKEVLPAPKDELQVIVHLADYMASRKRVSVDYPV
ncbi:hypothetical protein [Bacillus phage SP8]|nr:hypothetical protein [Bacillus phage SP8]